MKARIKSTLICLLVMLAIGSIYIVIVDQSIREQELKPVVNRTIIKFRIDSRFSSKEIVLIKKALREWEEKSGGLVRLKGEVIDIPTLEMYTWQEDFVPTIYDASSYLHWPAHTVLIFGARRDHLGMTIILSGDVFVMDKRANLFKATVAHEIGHVIIGNYHSNDPRDLMYPYLSEKNKNITHSDIKMLRKHRKSNGKAP